MQRRHLLSLAASGSLVAWTSGGLPSVDPSLTTVISDVGDIAGGLSGILPIIGKIAGLSTTVGAKINAAVANLQFLAAQITTVNSTTDAQPIVQKVETDVNTIVIALAGIPLPPPVSIALQAASLLLPIIEASVNLLIPAKVAARAAKAQLSPDQARNILRALAHKS